MTKNQTARTDGTARDGARGRGDAAGGGGADSPPTNRDLAHLVMEWVRTPGNHGGNPYMHEFVKVAEQIVDGRG